MVKEEPVADGYRDGQIGKIKNRCEYLHVIQDSSEIYRTTQKRGLFDIHFNLKTVDNKSERYRVLLDSGASCNVVPSSFVEMLALGCSENVKTKACNESSAKVASGASMKFERYEATFDLEFNSNLKLNFANSKVHKSNSKLLILGAPVLLDNEVETRIINKNDSKVMTVLIRKRP